MQLEENQELWIFKDHQREETALAKVKLISFEKFGLPYILEDLPADRQVTYGTAYWRCEVVSTGSYYPVGCIRTFPIRVVLDNNVLQQEEIKEEEENNEQYTKQDIFYEVDGEQCF